MKKTTLPVIHIAGPYNTNFQQYCKHCGMLLADDALAHARGEMTRGWAEESVVTVHEPAPGQKKMTSGSAPHALMCQSLIEE